MSEGQISDDGVANRKTPRLRPSFWPVDTGKGDSHDNQSYDASEDKHGSIENRALGGIVLDPGRNDPGSILRHWSVARLRRTGDRSRDCRSTLDVRVQRASATGGPESRVLARSASSCKA